MTTAEPIPQRLRIALVAIFFASGLAALVYQIVWLKYLGFVFGNSVYAAATLIAIYLAGLGLGGYVFARWFRERNALLVYAVLEGIIGAIGAQSPKFFQLLDSAYVASYHAFADAPVTLAVARALFAALFLLPPTMLMGGTLPVLVRWLGGEDRDAGVAVPVLYAANTFGATAGVAFAGFFGIPRLGLVTTLACAVGLNILLAVAAVVLLGIERRAQRGDDEAEPLPETDSATPALVAPDLSISPRGLLLASLLMGFAAIADEVFWSRILILHLGSSVYSYSIMLFCFLVGLAAGSALVAPVIERSNLAKLLARLEGALAGVLALQVALFGIFPDLLEGIAGVTGISTPGQRMAAFIVSVLIAVAPPTMLMGATFPVVVKLYGRARGEAESRAVGPVYFWNTVGSVSGSLAAGFVLVRLLGSQNGLFAMAVIGLLIGVWLWMRSGRGRAEGLTLGAGAAVLALSFAFARPDQVILSAGVFADSGAPILVFREDVTATVTFRKINEGFMSLELNGVNVAGTSEDLRGTQKLQGHLPLLMHKNPKKVLHIGFGSGGTAWSVSRHAVEQITIAEISPEVLEVSDSHLRSENHGVLDDPRVVEVINDGRNFVLASPEKFDAILSDSIHPRYAGNGSLYTLDYFELCRERLAPGGVISMWLPMYSMTTPNYLMILRAFQEVFPNTTVWYVPNVPNSFTIVIGRLEDGPVPLARMDANMTPAIREDLRQVGINGVYGIASALMLDPEGVKAITRGVPPHVDDLPLVEYESGRLLDREGSWLRNFALLAQYTTPLERGIGGADPAKLAITEEIRDRRSKEHLAVFAGMVARRDQQWKRP